jgi:hypothetical protein
MIISRQPVWVEDLLKSGILPSIPKGISPYLIVEDFFLYSFSFSSFKTLTFFCIWLVSIFKIKTFFETFFLLILKVWLIFKKNRFYNISIKQSKTYSITYYVILNLELFWSGVSIFSIINTVKPVYSKLDYNVFPLMSKHIVFIDSFINWSVIKKIRF